MTLSLFLFFLSQAFSEGAASSFDYSLKEKAPFTIQNALGLPMFIQHSSNLRIVDSPGSGKLHEVAAGESIDMTYSELKPLARGSLSALQRQESLVFLGMGENARVSLCKITFVCLGSWTWYTSPVSYETSVCLI